MTVRTSKRAQLEALGWKFTAIPRHWPAGSLLHDPQRGLMNRAFDDYKHPAGWLVTPPDGHPVAPRRFDGTGLNPPVRWAWDQAMAPRPDPNLGGVASLVALMGAARTSGVVADVADEPGPAAARRPDAELLSLCREVAACERLEETLRDDTPAYYKDKAGYLAVSKRVAEVRKTKDTLLPQIVDLAPTTPAGLLAKAEVLGALFKNARGQRADAVRALVRDLTAVLGRAGA